MEILVTKYMDSINKQFNKSELELKKIKFGLQVIIINIGKLAIAIMSAYILNLMNYAVLTILFMIIVKKYSFGLHAKSNKVCTIVTTVMVLGIAYISKHNLINMKYIIVLAIIAFLGICKYAPADTTAHPLIGEKLRSKLKKKAIISIISLYVVTFALNINYITTIIVLTAFIQSLLINPLTYKLLNREWNNYEKYNNNNKQ